MHRTIVAFALATLAATPAFAGESAVWCPIGTENLGTDLILVNDEDQTWMLIESIGQREATVLFRDGHNGPLECSGDEEMCRMLVGTEALQVAVEVEPPMALLALRRDNGAEFVLTLDLEAAVATAGGEPLQCNKGYPPD